MNTKINTNTNTICLRLADNYVHDADRFADRLHLSRAEYIRKAIMLMNKKMQQLEKYQRLQMASLKTRETSMEVNREFSDIEYDIKD